jgi:outer membrane receptor protein involved in Fe transport
VDADIDFARYPRNSLTLWTAYRLPSTFLKGLRASIGYRYVSKRYTTFRGQYISDQYTIDPYHVVDLAFEYPLKFFSGQTMETRLEFGIKNIFDEEYVESNRHGTENFPGQPRVCWSRLSAAF